MKHLGLATRMSLILFALIAFQWIQAGQRSPGADLIQAIKANDTALVIRLINSGANPNSTGEDEVSALQLASSKGNTLAIQKLLEFRANPDHVDYHGNTALIYAAKYGHSKIVSLLIENGTDVNKINFDGLSALDVAIDLEPAVDPLEREQRIEIVRMLLSKKAKVNRKDSKGMSPYLRAAKNGHYPYLQLIYKADVDPGQTDKSGNTVLHHALMSSKFHLIPLILKKTKLVNTRNNKGQPPLEIAIRNRHAQSVGLLLSSGASFKAPLSNGLSPLMMAASLNDSHSAKLLTKFGADPNREDQVGNSALSISYIRGHFDLFESLKKWSMKSN